MASQIRFRAASTGGCAGRCPCRDRKHGAALRHLPSDIRRSIARGRGVHCSRPASPAGATSSPPPSDPAATTRSRHPRGPGHDCYSLFGIGWSQFQPGSSATPACSSCACHRDTTCSPRSTPDSGLCPQRPEQAIPAPNTPGTRPPEATLGPLGCHQADKHSKKIDYSRKRSTHHATRGFAREGTAAAAQQISRNHGGHAPGLVDPIGLRRQMLDAGVLGPADVVLHPGVGVVALRKAGCPVGGLVAISW